MVSPDVLLKCAFLMTLLLADRTLKHGLFTTFKSNVLQQATSVFVTSTTANTTMASLKHVAKQPIPLCCNTVTIISLELDKIRVRNTAVFCIKASPKNSPQSHIIPQLHEIITQVTNAISSNFSSYIKLNNIFIYFHLRNEQIHLICTCRFGL